MDKKNLIKIIPIVIIAVFLVFTGIRTLIGKDSKPEEQETNEVAVDNEESTEETTESNSEIATEGETEVAEDTQEKVRFSDLELSVFKYEIHPKIEEKLDVVKFDEALYEFLSENANYPDYKSMPHAFQIITVKSIPYLTIDLDSDYYMFDMHTNDTNNSTVSCVFRENDDNYYFEFYQGSVE